MTFQLSHIAEIMKGELLANLPEIAINSIFTDSRAISESKNGLFFCIKGKRNNGHDYISDLYLKGITAFVIDEAIDIQKYPNAQFIKVEDSLKAIQYFAADIRQQFKGNMLAITGSNGKTIVKEWLFQLLHSTHSIIRSPRSYNSQIGVPLSIYNLEKKYDLAIIEAGISQPDEMQKLASIIQPDEGLITNIGNAHLENFKNKKQLAVEKWKLFSTCKTIFCCIDYEEIKELAEKSNQNIISWSKKDISADLYASSINKTATGSTQITIMYQENRLAFSIPFNDRASIENAIICCLYMLHHKIPLQKIVTGMRQLSPVQMRLELKKGINGCTLINDSYNSDIASLSIALDYLIQQRQHKKKTVILSDILQTGYETRELCEVLARMLKNKKINRLLAIGKQVAAHKELFPENTKCFLSTKEFLRQFPLSQFNQEAILIKGARSFHFEKIVARLEQKTHETKLEVNLTALIHNFNYLKSLLKPKTKMMAMVKAFSYGAGSFEIANALEYHRADYLAVAYTDEGIALRKAGIKMPIMVISPEQGSFQALLDYHLEPEIYNFSNLRRFIKTVDNVVENKPFKIHIKLDSGMHRLGFDKEDIPQLVEWIKSKENIKVESVFSHLAASENNEEDDFTQQQIHLFSELFSSLEKALGYRPIKHILNTNGVLRFPEAQFDMVRVGIGLHGISAEQDENLKMVSRLTTNISQIKNIQPGETIGYARSGKVRRNMQIAVIPIGYADGLIRLLGNKNWEVLINNEKAAIIGNVCMDMCMVDVTEINCKEGDRVVVFGPENSLYKMSQKALTIPYEILSSIAQRVKRVFYWGEPD